ncbi:hypothetical protein OPV22_001972 [Ensete ventricosum]|uniref:PH domain-containing protein n=1 Tax=Ensete ventricosum TaxID=4639 RepID=A0AAV8RVE9_ENSVE|nr:hypothetical protein OPV22_001972 [Ensete ventricosum]
MDDDAGVGLTDCPPNCWRKRPVTTRKWRSKHTESGLACHLTHPTRERDFRGGLSKPGHTASSTSASEAATCLPGGFFNHESFPGEGLMEEEDKMGPTTWGGGCSVRVSVTVTLLQAAEKEKEMKSWIEYIDDGIFFGYCKISLIGERPLNPKYWHVQINQAKFQTRDQLRRGPTACPRG